MRWVNECTYEVRKNRIIIVKNSYPTKLMWLPKQLKFKVYWHPQNKCGGLRRLHIIIRLPFLHIVRNNGFTKIGNKWQLMIFNNKRKGKTLS